MDAPRRPCTTPGCPTRHPGTGRCPGCRARQRRTLAGRRESWLTLYGPAWPAIRLDYLTRHPFCALCGRQATVPDHHPKGIRLLRKLGVLDPHADRRLRPLCVQCHNQETARKEPGGWNRDRSR